MFKGRVEKLRGLMKEKGLDGALFVGDPNRNYLSGFTGEESYSVITLDKAFFITDPRFTEQAKNQVADVYEKIEFNKNISFGDVLAKIVEDNNIKKLGFEEDVLSYGSYSLYKSKVNCELAPLDGITEQIREVKEESEIVIMKKAAEIADAAFDHIIKFIKPGITERDIALELEFFMKKRGASALSFPTIIASGERGSLPHGVATDKVIKTGEMITLDYGCVYEEYCSDMTRTVAVGKPSEKMLEIYNIVKEAEERALAVIKSGLPAIDADKAARDYIIEKGYGANFGHSLGHGVGRQIHEAPTVGYKNAKPLKAGMVITDEPGIYVPGLGGVRIEDTVIVTETGCEIITKSTKELVIIE